METFGEYIRQLRENAGLPIRKIAAQLDIDSSLLGRIERGHRKATREQIVKLANLLQAEKDELLTLWLADQVTAVVADDKKIADKALNIAKKNINQ